MPETNHYTPPVEGVDSGEGLDKPDVEEGAKNEIPGGETPEGEKPEPVFDAGDFSGPNDPRLRDRWGDKHEHYMYLKSLKDGKTKYPPGEVLTGVSLEKAGVDKKDKDQILEFIDATNQKFKDKPAYKKAGNLILYRIEGMSAFGVCVAEDEAKLQELGIEQDDKLEVPKELIDYLHTDKQRIRDLEQGSLAEKRVEKVKDFGFKIPSELDYKFDESNFSYKEIELIEKFKNSLKGGGSNAEFIYTYGDGPGDTVIVRDNPSEFKILPNDSTVRAVLESAGYQKKEFQGKDWDSVGKLMQESKNLGGKKEERENQAGAIKQVEAFLEQKRKEGEELPAVAVDVLDDIDATDLSEQISQMPETTPSVADENKPQEAKPVEKTVGLLERFKGFFLKK